MKIAILFVIVGTIAASAMAQPAAVPQSLSGTWIADLSKSLPPISQIQSVSLQITIAGDTVSVTDNVMDAAGHNMGFGTLTYQTDGKEHPNDGAIPGMVMAARWNGPNMLETILAKGGQTVRVTFEMSADGKRLTTTTLDGRGKQVIAFDRK